MKKRNEELKKALTEDLKKTKEDVTEDIKKTLAENTRKMEEVQEKLERGDRRQLYTIDISLTPYH